ncbi:septum formation inhibitor Maf [Bacillus sp. FJAT-42376]|uniref:Maf family protein n=1 Tax=Bacillus sp. FJAT-42376 TaxID=2014076 RepID=UPI000F5092DF|nr:Maf family protein [Bacillus sp. FJAT-42376]AZB43801.1 septum formation inhibitor Maf [Bacillus sp. FJAT-42376]
MHAHLEQHLILASGSPRRKEILENLRIPFNVMITDADESIDPGLSPEDAVQYLAAKKARHAAAAFPDSFVVAADTVVVLDGRILGKPEDEQDAIRTLGLLSGRTHHVLTGVSILKGTKEKTFYVSTEVVFWDLSSEEIQSYAETGEPLDKAGSYGIQGLGGLFVKEIKGDYFSVVGLPASRLIRELREIGFSV